VTPARLEAVIRATWSECFPGGRLLTDAELRRVSRAKTLASMAVRLVWLGLSIQQDFDNFRRGLARHRVRPHPWTTVDRRSPTFGH
jgi:hypothetical protein